MRNKKLLVLLIASNVCIASSNVTVLSDTIEKNVPRPSLQSKNSDMISCLATSYPYTEKVNEQFATHGQVAYYIGGVTISNELFDIDTYMCVDNNCTHRKTTITVYPYTTFGDNWTLSGEYTISTPGKYEEDVIIQMTSRNTSDSCINTSKNYVTVVQ